MMQELAAMVVLEQVEAVVGVPMQLQQMLKLLMAVVRATGAPGLSLCACGQSEPTTMLVLNFCIRCTIFGNLIVLCEKCTNTCTITISNPK